MLCVPNHVALIMDGNGRWAANYGLPRYEGHRRGASVVRKILRIAEKIGVKYVTLYAFSSENFSRPMDEVNFLMKLFEKSLRKYGKKFVKNGVRFRVIGDMSKLPALLQTTICEFSNDTKNFSRFNVTIAINYGARDEIVQAVRNICRDKNIDPDEIDWGFLQKYLYTADLPDPDLIIRTSGELRLSNFLLLQGAYSELFFTKTLWPDFWEREFREAIENYQHRERRMGA